MVLILVTNNDFSIISPVVSAIFTLSPILNGFIYVITTPATILLIAEDDPNENNIPKNTENP